MTTGMINRSPTRTPDDVARVIVARDIMGRV